MAVFNGLFLFAFHFDHLFSRTTQTPTEELTHKDLIKPALWCGRVKSFRDYVVLTYNKNDDNLFLFLKSKVKALPTGIIYHKEPCLASTITPQSEG